MPTTGSISNSEFTHREDTAAVSGDVGAFVLGVRNDTAAVVTSTDGDYSQISTDSAGRIGISDLGGSITVDGTITISGTVTTADNKVEDVPHVSGDTGSFILAVRNDANTAFTNTNGDYSPVAVNANGAVAINDGGNSITVDGTVSISGTVAVTQSTSPWVISGTVTADTELPAASALADADANPTTSRIGSNLLGFNGTTWDRIRAIGNNADAVAVTTLGNVTTIGYNEVFNGTTWDRMRSGTATGSVLVNNPTAANLNVTVGNGSGASAVNIQDGGNSITVDGTVSISGTVTVDTELPAATAMADADANPTTSRIGSNLLGFNGTTWDRLRSVGNNTDAVAVTTLGILTTDAYNEVFNGTTWDRMRSGTATGSVLVNNPTAANLNVTVGNGAGAAAVNIQDGGNSITVDGAVTVSGTVATNSERAEDSGHTSGQIGNFVLAVRNDANAVLTSTDLDYSPFAVNSAGAIAINDGGNSITVDGTVSAAQSGAWSVTVLNGAGAAAVNIQDGGNSITVDGSVSITGTVTVDTELPAATVMADADANPTTSRIGSNLLGFNGTTWDRLRSVGNNADAVAVSTLGILTTDAYNEVFNGTTWDRMRSGTATGSVLVNNPTAANLNVTVGNGAGAAAVNIQDGGNSITVDGSVSISGTVAVTQSTSPWVTQTGAEKAEDSPHTTGQTGNFVLAVRNDANAVLTSTDLDYSPIAVNSAGAVSINDGGTSITVDGTVAATQSGAWAVSVNNAAGAAAVNIQDGGNSITVDGTVGISGTVTTADNKVEDAPHTTGDTGSFSLAVRNDAGTPLAGTTGDYIPFTTDANGDLYTTTGRAGTLANGAETAVAAAAVQILAANTARKKLLVQNTGTANIRVGVTGVTATTGYRLIAGASMIIDMPNCPTNAIFAIREGATSSIAFAQEIT